MTLARTTLVCKIFEDIKLLVVPQLFFAADFKNASSFAVSGLVFLQSLISFFKLEKFHQYFLQVFASAVNKLIHDVNKDHIKKTMISCWLLLNFNGGIAKPIGGPNGSAMPTLGISCCCVFDKGFYCYLSQLKRRCSSLYKIAS